MIVCVRVCVRARECACLTPRPQSGCDTRSFFNLSKAGLNSEFSFFYMRCLNEADEPRFPYYVLIAGERTNLCISRGHKHGVKYKLLRPGFEV